MRLRRERYLLPVQATDITRPYAKACRQRFGGRSLRDAADFVCECGDDAGPHPDHPASVLRHGTGTIGAKQALLAALAHECGCEDIELMVACCEMQLPADRGAPVRGGRPATLPLAVCWLRIVKHRVQIGGARAEARALIKPITEIAVLPEALMTERTRLYRAFAADWCRALEVNPAQFAMLRSWQLRTAPDARQYEELMGHTLPRDFAPEL